MSGGDPVATNVILNFLSTTAGLLTAIGVIVGVVIAAARWTVKSSISEAISPLNERISKLEGSVSVLIYYVKPPARKEGDQDD